MIYELLTVEYDPSPITLPNTKSFGVFFIGLLAKTPDSELVLMGNSVIKGKIKH